MFGFLKPKPLKLIYSALDALEREWALPSFTLVRSHVERLIEGNKVTLINSVQSGSCTPKQIVVAEIANCSGDLLESGSLHIYRGVLSPSGESVMAVFRRALGEMVATGHATEADIAEQISCVLSNIRTVG
ncbi:MAG: hypothetical protein Q8M07_08735 [Prosthecobacter sp.]|nr:hypothetical protein [Prosthecobacter sp.]